MSDAEKNDIFDMMVHYIFKKDLLEANGIKAAFIKENFPDVWAYAESHITDKPRIITEWQKRMETVK